MASGSEAVTAAPANPVVDSADPAAPVFVAANNDPPAPLVETDREPASDPLPAIALGALAGAAGLGLAAFLINRRRKIKPVRPDARPELTPNDKPPLMRAEELERAAMASPFAIRDRTEALPSVDQSDRRAETAPVELPEGPVPQGAARTALIDRMVAAEPDAANPFRSIRSRRRRARMILATREQTMRDRAVQPFDYREYEPTGAMAPASDPALVD